MSIHKIYFFTGISSKNVTVPALLIAFIPRKEMLTKKQEELHCSVEELEDSVTYIDWKKNFYDEVLSDKRPYVSNLIRAEE